MEKVEKKFIKNNNTDFVTVGYTGNTSGKMLWFLRVLLFKIVKTQCMSYEKNSNSAT